MHDFRTLASLTRARGRRLGLDRRDDLGRSLRGTRAGPTGRGRLLRGAGERAPGVKAIALTASTDEAMMMEHCAGARGRNGQSPVGNVFAKLEVENRAQAVVQAWKPGLVRLEELE